MATSTDTNKDSPLTISMEIHWGKPLNTAAAVHAWLDRSPLLGTLSRNGFLTKVLNKAMGMPRFDIIGAELCWSDGYCEILSSAEAIVIVKRTNEEIKERYQVATEMVTGYSDFLAKLSRLPARYFSEEQLPCSKEYLMFCLKFVLFYTANSNLEAWILDAYAMLGDCLSSDLRKCGNDFELFRLTERALIRARMSEENPLDAGAAMYFQARESERLRTLAGEAIDCASEQRSSLTDDICKFYGIKKRLEDNKAKVA